MSDSIASPTQTATPTATEEAAIAASHSLPAEIASASPAADAATHSSASESLEPASGAPVAVPSVPASPADEAEPAVRPDSDDAQSAPSVASAVPASPASDSAATELASLKPTAAAAKPASQRRSPLPLLSASASANRSALLSSGRSSTAVPRSRTSDAAKPTATPAAPANASAKPKPKPAATAAATSAVRAKPAVAAATRKPLAAASAAASSAPKPSARPPSARRLSATPRKPIVLAQPPPSHSAARGNRRVPQPPEPPGYSGLLYSHVLGVIFSYLEFASLRSAVQVSPSWRSAVGAMRPIVSAKFKFVHPLKKHMQINGLSPLVKHVSQLGNNDAIYYSQEINLTLLQPLAQWFSHLTTMNVKIGASAWLSKATASTFPFPPSLTALGWTFAHLPEAKLPSPSLLNQVTHQLLASIGELPALTRLYLNLHWTPTLDLSAVQSPHDRGSLRHFTLDFQLAEPLSAKQNAVLRSMTQLESMVLLAELWEGASPQLALLAVPHPPFAWQRILRLRDLNLNECMDLIPPLTELRELDVYCISDGLVALHSLPHLTRLSLTMAYSHAFKAAESAAITVGLAGCVHLTSLKIHEAHISTAQLTQILAPLAELRELSLSYLSRVDSYAWATSGPITQTLRTLNIAASSKYVPNGGFQCLRELRALRRLEFVDCGWDGLSNEELRLATPPSSVWPNLQRFRFEQGYTWR